MRHEPERRRAMHPTSTLARFVAETQPGTLPEPVRDECVRSLVDWLACTLGGCLDVAPERPTQAVADTEATMPGLGRRGPLESCAEQAASAAAALDFAAVHAPTGAAIGVPVFAALLPLAEARAAAGRAVVHAYAVGAEAACRVAATLHHDGVDSGPLADTSGAVGAAAACARLLGLDAEAAAYAIAIAGAGAFSGASRSSPPDYARAARTGLAAALRAERRAAPMTEAAHGAISDLLESTSAQGALGGLGTEWQLRQCAYRTYPCAMALQPVVEACLALRARHRPLVRHIAAVGVRMHPALLAQAAPRDPADAVQARRSVHHAAAVALVDGAAGVEQFCDDRIASTRVAELRQRIQVFGDETLAPGAARILVHMADGRCLQQTLRCARGSPARPLTDAELSDKLRVLAGDVLATDPCERLLALAWNVAALADIGALVRATVPEDELEPAELPGSPLIPR